MRATLWFIAMANCAICAMGLYLYSQLIDEMTISFSCNHMMDAMMICGMIYAVKHSIKHKYFLTAPTTVLTPVLRCPDNRPLSSAVSKKIVQLKNNTVQRTCLTAIVEKGSSVTQNRSNKFFLNMKKFFSFFAFAILCYFNTLQVQAQTITVCHTDGFDYGYSLDGTYRDYSILKLNNPNNFGPAGACPYDINVVPLNDISATGIAAAGCNIIDMGVPWAASGYDVSNYTEAQLQALKTWSDASINNVIIAYQGGIDPLSDATYDSGNYGNVNPNGFTPFGESIFLNGNFGSTGSFNQGGSYQGYFWQFDPNDGVIVQDGDGNPTGILDCSNGNVYFADVDLVTENGGLTSSSSITSNTDIFWANLMCGLSDLVTYGTAATDACSFNFSCDFADATADCDGDGVPNGTDSDPGDPCLPAQLEGYTGFDASNMTWASVDCDGDGDTNGAEVTAGSDPYCATSTVANPISCDPCVPDPNALACPTGDFDGDGVANDTDTDPSDPCIPVQTEGYTGFDISNAIWTAADCDGDGDTNGAEVTAGSSPYCDQSTVSNPSGTCLCNAGSAAPQFGN